MQGKNERKHKVMNDKPKSKPEAAAEYAKVDQSKMNSIQKYTDVTLKSEADDSGPPAKSTKCRVRCVLAAATVLACVAILAMFVLLYLKIASHEICRAKINESMSSNNSMTFTEQLDAIKKGLDYLNSSFLIF